MLLMTSSGVPFMYVFLFCWLCWVFITTRGLSLVTGVRATLCCGAGVTAVAALVVEHQLSVSRL